MRVVRIKKTKEVSEISPAIGYARILGGTRGGLDQFDLCCQLFVPELGVTPKKVSSSFSNCPDSGHRTASGFQTTMWLWQRAQPFGRVLAFSNW